LEARNLAQPAVNCRVGPAPCQGGVPGGCEPSPLRLVSLRLEARVRYSVRRRVRGGNVSLSCPSLLKVGVLLRVRVRVRVSVRVMVRVRVRVGVEVRLNWTGEVLWAPHRGHGRSAVPFEGALHDLGYVAIFPSAFRGKAQGFSC
jgi:hypothetical protein